MKEVTIQMINLWKMNNVDWLGYQLNEFQNFNYHHIIKKEWGGQEDIDNGAILILETSHRYIHLIEYYDFDRYIYLNRILKEINIQRTMPNLNQIKKINNALLGFERENCSRQNSKGKLIIKEKYTKRIY